MGFVCKLKIWCTYKWCPSPRSTWKPEAAMFGFCSQFEPLTELEVLLLMSWKTELYTWTHNIPIIDPTALMVLQMVGDCDQQLTSCSATILVKALFGPELFFSHEETLSSPAKQHHFLWLINMPYCDMKLLWSSYNLPLCSSKDNF